MHLRFSGLAKKIKMCIRDRIYFYHVKIIRISVFYINAQVKQWLFYTPVSYTHLDVYKRQKCGVVRI